MKIHNPIEDNTSDPINGVLVVARDEEYVDAEQLVPTEDEMGSTIDEGIL